MRAHLNLKDTVLHEWPRAASSSLLCNTSSKDESQDINQKSDAGCVLSSVHRYSLPPQITGRKIADGCQSVLQLYYIYTYKQMETATAVTDTWKILPPKQAIIFFLYTKQQFFQLDLETGLEIGADCLSHKQLGRVTQYSTTGQFRLRSIFHPFNYVISIKGHMGMMPNVNAVSGNQARVPKEKEFPYLLWK